MKTSLQDQKQKLNLLKPRRPASSASRLIALISNNPRRKLGIFVAVTLSGLGVSIAASSLQHQTPTSNSHRIQTDSTTVTTHQTTSSDTESNQSYVTINGEKIPLENGSLSRSYTTPSGSHIELNVSSENTTNTHSSNISIHSTSSMDENQERGSP